MTFHLQEQSLTIAIRHLCRYGDTDIFPHLAELCFLADEEKNVIDEIKKLDLDSYQPVGAIECLAPKSKFGFRIAHQLPFLETLVFTSCVVEIGQAIENKRQGSSGIRAFSYRYLPDSKIGQLFRTDRTYKDWILKQKETIASDKAIRSILSTDISDFYARINFHRIENLLDEVAPSHGAARFIKKHVRVIRAKQSFGLPVGGSAARLMAELALIDTDQSLRDRGVKATRFVDDFRIYLTSKDSPYDVLGVLAEELGINEGLSLNNAKTSITRRRDFLRRLDDMTSDVSDEAEGVALETLTAEIYFDDEPDEADVAKLKGLNLVAILEKEVTSEVWDMGRIKVVFRALKITKPPEAIDFIISNWNKLVVFAKELCLIMEALEEDNKGCFSGLLASIIASILTPPASSVQMIRTWLLEILVRGIVAIKFVDLAKLESLNTVPDRRQMLFIRGRLGQKVYFRKQKTSFHAFNYFEIPALLWGASCLPQDELEKWTASVKVQFDKPLGSQFIKWIITHKDDLNSRLKAKSIDQPE